jgi:hypothetical protein
MDYDILQHNLTPPGILREDASGGREWQSLLGIFSKTMISRQCSYFWFSSTGAALQRPSFIASPTDDMKFTHAHTAKQREYLINYCSLVTSKSWLLPMMKSCVYIVLYFLAKIISTKSTVEIRVPGTMIAFCRQSVSYLCVSNAEHTYSMWHVDWCGLVYTQHRHIHDLPQRWWYIRYMIYDTVDTYVITERVRMKENNIYYLRIGR